MNFGSALNIKPALNYAVEVDTSIFSGIVFSMKIPSGMRIVFEGQIDGPWLPVTFQNQTTLADETTTLTSANYRGDVSRYAKVRFRAATVFDVAGTVTGVVFNTINAVEVSNEVTVTGALTATVAGVATAANQTTQITAVNLTNTEIGATNETAAPETNTRRANSSNRYIHFRPERPAETPSPTCYKPDRAIPHIHRGQDIRREPECRSGYGRDLSGDRYILAHYATSFGDILASHSARKRYFLASDATSVGLRFGVLFPGFFPLRYGCIRGQRGYQGFCRNHRGIRRVQ